MKLNQVLAVEVGAKKAGHETITRLFRALQNPEVMNGHHRRYEPASENEPELPPESKLAQLTESEAWQDLQPDFEELIDITATKDVANCSAKASIFVDGKPIIKNVPPTFILFLEKKLADLRTFVEKMAELDPSKKWAFDKNSGKWTTDPVKVARTQKRQQAIVLYAATPEHPAQTQLITEDVTVGHWVETKESGAIPRSRKKEILARIDKLLRAAKVAREEANDSQANRVSVASTVFDFILGVSETSSS